MARAISITPVNDPKMHNIVTLLIVSLLMKKPKIAVINGAVLKIILMMKIGMYIALVEIQMNPAIPHKILNTTHILEAFGKSFITCF